MKWGDIIFQKFIHKSAYLHPFIRLSIKYRYIVFLFFGLGIYADATLYTGKTLIGLYAVLMVFLGLVFANPWQGIVNSFLITLCRFSISPEGFPTEIEIIIFQWFSYFFVWLAVSLLVRNSIEQKENLIRVTKVLANTLDSRDKYTAFHSTNVARYSELIAKEMELPEKYCREIKLGAQLHDIGKIGIPENILNKPSRLTAEEYNIIKTHTVIGYDMVKHVNIFEKNGVLDAILYHHEREDGTGYPEGLKSEQIPMIAKIIAVADSFDAMTSNRVYRREKSFEYAVNEIMINKGKHYDPDVVNAFSRIMERHGEKILEINDQKEEDSIKLQSMRMKKIRANFSR